MFHKINYNFYKFALNDKNEKRKYINTYIT